MPVIKIWCLLEIEKALMRALDQEMRNAVAAIAPLGITSSDITCIFPADALTPDRQDRAIIIEVTGLFAKPQPAEPVRNRIAETLGMVAQRTIPDARLIECFVYPLKPVNGFWTSDQQSQTSFDNHDEITTETFVSDFFTRERLANAGFGKALRMRIVNACREKGLSTLGELRDFGEEKFHYAQNVGSTCLKAIRTLLEEYEIRGF